MGWANEPNGLPGTLPGAVTGRSTVLGIGVACRLERVSMSGLRAVGLAGRAALSGSPS
jgi:hypothetical protein